MEITVVTTMRNEGPHLLEWIAHHYAAGVTRFLVYTNDCEDGTEALLDLLPHVQCIRQSHGDKPPQWSALKAAWEHDAVQSAEWVMCLDCDEFINLNNSLKGISHLIHEVQADAIMLPWRLFGHNNQAVMSSEPTTKRFTKAAPEHLIYPAIGTYFKTLFRRNGPFRQFGVHRPRQKNAARHGAPIWVDGSGLRVQDQLSDNDTRIMNWGKPIARKQVQLNHYSLRSAAEFMVKRHRGLPNHRDKQVDLTYWVERNFNAVEDKSIAHMRIATKAVLDKFHAIPGVTQAQEAAQAWHAAKFNHLMQHPDELNLFGRLLLAAGSTVPDPKTAMHLITAYGMAQQDG